ncbi:Ig-like domain-containing protein [Nannocystis sp. ILAH1]|uniref:Ig-like domain-containing protein n=1 Tax=Nannocystis sp. ILAH1 TaxID=2996789 RepID=UPI00226DF54E|nr:Ig-like domain-containing protein [Nannocystis sp. ILAH1]MCY0989738.1 Ig-like domain-containing protein [Nannocystis sp. ILAH1]
MSRHTFAPLTLLVFGACNTEQAYQDLIQNHGQTWDTTAAASTSGAVLTGGETAPTTSASGGSGSDGATAGTEGDTTPTGTSSGTQLDLPPELAFTVTPEAVQLATFVELAATCVDDVGVAEVRFFVDGTPLATVAALPFAAQWPVKSTDEDGPRTLRAECEDLAGHVVVDERVVDVTLPESGTPGWSDFHPSQNWASEALDASPAPDGSWWVCGYDTDGEGSSSMWIAHYTAGGVRIFDELISRGPGFFGTCSGIETFPGDPHRAAATGSWIKDGLAPTLWVGVIDETEDEFLRAEYKDGLLGEVGNDVAVTADHQIRVTGYRILDNTDHDIIYHAFLMKDEQSELETIADPTHTSDRLNATSIDVGEAIVALPDGRSLIAGRTADPIWGESRGIVALVGLTHQFVEADGWPYRSELADYEQDGFNDISVTAAGLVAAAGWWREEGKSRRPRLVQFELADFANLEPFVQPAMGGDFTGRSIARLSTGPVMVAATKFDPIENNDVLIDQYTAMGWDHDPNSAWPQVFPGFFHFNDEAHVIRVNAVDEILVVGFETIQLVKNGKVMNVRQAWLKAFHG